ncbi:protein containing DUF172 [mine drainage metagenome]|uniref:Protein containing DUF172 n=1 Tax=mine drainage metagenome TaxID=410659 RepID=T1BQE3_9ZZZZ
MVYMPGQALCVPRTTDEDATMTTHPPLDRLPTMASSDAKNGFAALLERVLHKPEPVVITRNARPTAVMMSIMAYERLVEAVPDPLAKLTAEFDALVARMQTPAAKSAVDALFTATPEQLGEAAVRGAGRPGH